MPIDPHDLAARLVALCQEMRDLDHGQVESACDIASDILSEHGLGDVFSDAADESLLDGIRWGHRAAVTVERNGGAIIRIRTKGGRAVTHEYAKAPSDLELAQAMRAAESLFTNLEAHS